MSEASIWECAAGQPDTHYDSVLFRTAADASPETHELPAFFHDLNLDQVVAAITANWQDYDLTPFFCTSLTDPDLIAYRQEVMRDLESAPVMRAVRAFSEAMRMMRGHLERAEKSWYKYEKERWFLNAVAVYCEAVTRLGNDLWHPEPASRGLRAFRDYLARYGASPRFGVLAKETGDLLSRLSAIRYSVLVKGRAVTVLPYAEEADYSAAVERTFEKFRRGAVREYRVTFPGESGLNHVEAQVLERVARLNPAVFRLLDTYCEAHAGYLDPGLARFDREIQFYVAWLTHLAPLRRAGLSFCYPCLARSFEGVEVQGAFDLALAATLVPRGGTVVCNDVRLAGTERILVVSGPNHGGKTTFARMFGQLHYLASLGCPVPGTHARLLHFDHLFTHFAREENILDLRGKLQDDLIRIRRILDQATPNSLVIMNEIFASTTLHDAVYLGRELMTRLSRLDLVAVCVTFLTELASFDHKTVSMVGSVDPDDPALRTYRLERRPADGLAYALAIAEKHRVTYRWLEERIRT